MTFQEELLYMKTFHVRRCEKCCGNCKFFERIDDGSGCLNMRQKEFDKRYNEFPSYYGAISGIIVDEGNVCDLWEENKDT